MNAFRTKLLAALFVPALAMAAGVASAAGDTSKATGQTATSPNMNDKSTTATSPSTNTRSNAMTNSTSSTASGEFARLDTNHDGKLSATEAAADPKVQAMWKELDTNNDGTVSQAEFNAHRADLK